MDLLNDSVCLCGEVLGLFMEIPVARKCNTGLAFDTEVVVANGTPERSVHVHLALSEVYLLDLHVFSVSTCTDNNSFHDRDRYRLNMVSWYLYIKYLFRR